MAMTIPEVQERIGLYRTAERSILESGQSYTVDGVTYSRANLRDIQTEINKLESILYKLQQGGSMRVRRVIFRDV